MNILRHIREKIVKRKKYRYYRVRERQLMKRGLLVSAAFYGRLAATYAK